MPQAAQLNQTQEIKLILNLIHFISRLMKEIKWN